MVQAKTELKARARELRRAGRTYDEIVAELGVSKSSVSLWVRDPPRPRTSPERMHAMHGAERTVLTSRCRVRSDAAIPCGVTRQHPKFWFW